MKIFVTLLVAISAMALKSTNFTTDDSNENSWQNKQRGQWISTGPSWKNAQDSNESREHKQRGRNSWRNAQSNESDSDEKQTSNHRHQQSRHQNQSVEEFDVVEVQPFRTKIMRRVQESDSLANQPEIKRKITKLVEDKLEVCKHQSVGSKNKANKHCLGRATGQMMQIIAAFENGSRDLPGSYDF